MKNHAGAGANLTDEEVPASMVERISSIMDAFSLPMSRLSLDEVTRLSGLPRSTAHRILEQLVHSEWVARVGGLYSLGQRSFRLGARDLVHERLRSASNPRLNELAYRTGLVVHLAAIDGTEIYYLDKFGGPSATRVPSQVGGRAPAQCTAVGKAILAYLPRESVHEQYADLVTRRTARSLPDISSLHHELSIIRARSGLAFERGECFPDIACVGTAIRDTRGPVAAISVVAAVDAPIEQLVPLLTLTAQLISKELVQYEASFAGAHAVA